jgi:hypothetical protein
MKFITGLITFASTAVAQTTIGSLHGYPKPQFYHIEQLGPEQYKIPVSIGVGSSVLGETNQEIDPEQPEKIINPNPDEIVPILPQDSNELGALDTNEMPTN